MSSGSPDSEPRAGTYLYAILRKTPLRELVDLAGVDGRPVRTVDAAGLTAVVSTVPFPAFEEDTLRQNLEDLRWLESIARAHHSVVDVVARQATTAPVSLVTVYNDDRRVRKLLTERCDEILAALDKVADRSEWGVKVYLDQPSAATPESTPESTPPAEGAGRSGADYLRRRRHALQEREQAAQAGARVAENVASRLARHAVAARRYQPQDPRLSGRTERMILNAAYLVDNDGIAAFQAAARSLDLPQVTIEVTGPWAPYSFITLDLAKS